MIQYRITVEPLDDQSVLMESRYGLVFDATGVIEWDAIRRELGRVIGNTIENHEATL